MSLLLTSTIKHSDSLFIKCFQSPRKENLTGYLQWVKLRKNSLPNYQLHSKYAGHSSFSLEINSTNCGQTILIESNFPFRALGNILLARNSRDEILGFAGKDFVRGVKCCGRNIIINSVPD